MRKAYLKDLQSQLLGSVTDSDRIRQQFSTDASIFQIMPEAVVYPKNTADVRKTVKLLAERAESGKPASVVARGGGTDQGGGSIGEGVQVVFPVHMQRLLKLDKTTVTVQPGMLFGTLQQILQTHGRFLPPYPASMNYSTVGGAVANNAAGEKSVKYGATRDFVKRLKVVLSDGSLIEAQRISARELNRKKGQTNLEGEIYRKVDSLILDHEDIITKNQPKITKNTTGYALSQVRGRDGSVDLAQLITGSQGTLGLVTEITLSTAPLSNRTTLLVGFFNDLTKACETVPKLRALKPSSLELVNLHLLKFVRHDRRQDIVGLVPETLPKIVLLIEFDDASHFNQVYRARRAGALLLKHATSFRVATDPIEQEALWKIRRSTVAALWLAEGGKQALPFIEDAVVPITKLRPFFDKTYKLFASHDQDIAIWGHAGDGNLHLQPLLDLSKKKDLDTLFKLKDEYADLVLSLEGSLGGQHNDGLIRTAYLEKFYGPELCGLFRAVKQIFDPHNILNPGKKTEVTDDYLRQHLRTEYSLGHLYNHLPQS